MILQSFCCCRINNNREKTIASFRYRIKATHYTTELSFSYRSEHFQVERRIAHITGPPVAHKNKKSSIPFGKTAGRHSKRVIWHIYSIRSILQYNKESQQQKKQNVINPTEAKWDSEEAAAHTECNAL